MDDFSHKGLGLTFLPKERVDRRDWHFKAISASLPEDIPRVVDNRKACGPVMDQKDTNSCVGHAFASIKDRLCVLQGRPLRFFSPLFAYWIARDAQGWTNKDKGAYIFDMIKQYRKYGISPDSLHPFSKGVFTKPDMFAYSFAKFFNRQNNEYYKITDVTMNDSFYDDVRLAIANGFGVEGGVKVFWEFYVPESGIIKAPISTGKVYGAHAIDLVGYVDVTQETYDKALKGEIGIETVIQSPSSTLSDKGFFILKNSWGTRYGHNGYALIPYEYVDEHGNDFWAIK